MYSMFDSVGSYHAKEHMSSVCGIYKIDLRLHSARSGIADRGVEVQSTPLCWTSGPPLCQACPQGCVVSCLEQWPGTSGLCRPPALHI